MNELGPLPTAKSLIQSLLLAADDRAYPARQLVSACALFQLTENNVRVALVRLQNEGILLAEGRGHYRLGPAASELAQEVSAWRQIESRIRPWDGAYVVVHCAGLGRSDRAALHKRQQALGLNGFAELDKGLYVRPDNLVGGVEDLRQRLYKLGLESQALVFQANQFGTGFPARIKNLWQQSALNQRYRSVQRQLDEWLERAEHLSPDQAAREAFLLGRPAIRCVVYDPLLPEGMVDTEARQSCFESVRRFDSAGRALWWQFFQFGADTTTAQGA
ncbi:MAG TPA: PaaX family transcriptional regulator C-terminal domain-containing protein [Aquabacterium sp.]|nr:PaaX family transcriptional regulator C-terminal domain-containing protein [Aquabacterium sp.]